MPARLVRSEAFETDVQSQVDWMERQGLLPRLIRFGMELHQLETVLAQFPDIGVRVHVRDAAVRKTLFRRLPFVVWYAHLAATNDVQLLRLFHAHQDRDLELPLARKGRRR